MIEHDNDFHAGFEFIEASIPSKIVGIIRKAAPKKFMAICRNVGRSLRGDEDALNILRRNRRERAKDLIYLGWMGGRWTKKGPPNGSMPS